MTWGKKTILADFPLPGLGLKGCGVGVGAGIGVGNEER